MTATGSGRAAAAAAAALLTLAAAAVAGRDLHVDAVNGSDLAGDGSPGAPFKTLTHAASQAQAADSVRVAPGLYDRPGNGEDFPILFSVSALSGAGAGRTIVRTGGENGIIIAATTACALVEDLELEGTPSGDAPAGGGIGLAGCFTLARSRIHGFARGATLRVFTSASLEACVLDGNEEAVVDDTSAVGGTVSVTLANNLVVGNGTGVRLIPECLPPCFPVPVVHQATVINNTIAGNRGDGLVLSGGGVTWLHGDLVNNVIAFNGGYGIADLAVNATLLANDFWANALGDWRNGPSPQADNRFVDPRFADPGAGDYRLASASPCIDAGRDEARTPPADLDGAPRPRDGDGDGTARSDIGAYEAPAVGLRLDLRRADFTRLRPLDPGKAGVFPFGPDNPRTPVVVAGFDSGDADPAAGFTSNADLPLAFYQVVPDPAAPLLTWKDRALDSPRFVLGPR